MFINERVVDVVIKRRKLNLMKNTEQLCYTKLYNEHIYTIYLHNTGLYTH